MRLVCGYVKSVSSEGGENGSKRVAQLAEFNLYGWMIDCSLLFFFSFLPFLFADL